MTSVAHPPLKPAATPLANNTGRCTLQRGWKAFGSPPGAWGCTPAWCGTNGIAIADPGSYLGATTPANPQAMPYNFSSTTSPAASGLFMAWRLPLSDLIALRFAASHATNPDGKTAKARIWTFSDAIISPTVQEVIGTYRGELSLTCGNQTLPTGSGWADPSTTRIVSKWADTITIPTADLTRTPGMQITGSPTAAANDTVAVVTFDQEGEGGLIVQIVDDTNDGSVGWLPIARVL